MSLAATLSASGMRPASFLPAIKCSNCGDEIEIARMGDHICGGAPPSPPQHQARTGPPALSNPYTMSPYSTPSHQYQAPPSPSSANAPLWPPKAPVTTFATSPLQHAHSPSDSNIQNPSLQPAALPSQRAMALPMPPRINPDAANKPFLGPQYPRSASPASPVGSIRSGRSGSRPPMIRGLTKQSSFGRDRSPSPELASNLDCAFPTFPTSSSRPGTSNGRKTPVERAPSRAADKEFGVAPLSPRNGQSIMPKAYNTRNGPFDPIRRPSNTDETPPTPGLPATLAISRPERQASPERQNPDTLPARKASLPKETPILNNGYTEEPLDSFPAVPTYNPYEQTMPLPSSSMGSTPQFEQTENNFDATARGRKPSIDEDFGPPPADFFDRPSSRHGRTDPRLQDAPPVPKSVQQYRQAKHAPSDSASSASSTSHTLSHTNTSEGPSPISSAASSIDMFSPLSQATYEREERPKSLGRPAGYSTKVQQQNPGLRAEQPSKRSPPPNFARPRPRGQSIAADQMPPMEEVAEPLPLERVPTREDNPWPTRGASRGIDRKENSRSPPMPQWPAPPSIPAALSIPPPSDDYDPYKPMSPNPATHDRSKSVTSEYSVYQPDEVSTAAAPPMPAMPVRPLQRRNTTARQHICRGCHKVIEGKSVKAADGRLTGRWHKNCFTCKTCAQPFSTADFYVIDDQPFCKQHYHEKNGSLCHGCKRGIEGQYLETGSGRTGGSDRKFHPACFTCSECRLILSNDYFEINGKVYCERHARSQPRPGPGPGYGRPGMSGLQPPNRREVMAERRTTKLMMIRASKHHARCCHGKKPRPLPESFAARTLSLSSSTAASSFTALAARGAASYASRTLLLSLLLSIARRRFSPTAAAETQLSTTVPRILSPSSQTTSRAFISTATPCSEIVVDNHGIRSFLT